LGVIEHMGLKLFGREVIFEEFKPISTRYLNVTDGRTDGQTDRRLTVASPRSALAPRGKNRQPLRSNNIGRQFIKLYSR